MNDTARRVQDRARRIGSGWRSAGPARGERRPLLWVAAGCGGLFAVAAAVLASRPRLVLGFESASHAWSVAHRPAAAAVSAARLLTDTGSGLVPWLMVLVAGVVALYPADRPTGGRVRVLCVFLLVMAAGQAVRYGVLSAVARPRPPRADWAAQASGFSFPSGHTTTSALAAGLLCCAVAGRARPRAAWCAGAVLAAWALAVGLTRIYLGVHWAGDVLGGWLFAAAWLSASGYLLPGFPWPGSRPGPPPGDVAAAVSLDAGSARVPGSPAGDPRPGARDAP